MFEAEPYDGQDGKSEASLSGGLREPALLQPPAVVEILASQSGNTLKLSTARSAHGNLSSVRRVFLRSTALPVLSSCHPAIVTRQSVPSSPQKHHNTL